MSYTARDKASTRAGISDRVMLDLLSLNPYQCFVLYLYSFRFVMIIKQTEKEIDRKKKSKKQREM